MNKVVCIVAALLVTILPASSEEAASPKDREVLSVDGRSETWKDVLERLSQSQPELGRRLTQAIETVQSACASDISNFCGMVTPGEGRLLLCMRAHDDQLSRRCELALYRVSRDVRSAVERITQTCLNDIQAQCGNADKVSQCVMQKSASFSPPCQTVIAALRAKASDTAALRGMPVYSSDDTNLGQVAEVIRGPEGNIQSIQVDIGRVLGLGSKIVTIDAAQIQQLPDRIRLFLSGDQVRSMPEAKKQ